MVNWILVGILTLVMLAGRVYLAIEGFFPFSWDFGRDMLWVRQISELYRPMLVGAWGSLEGTFFGPGYFYLLAIPYWLSEGDPRASVIMVSLLLTIMIPLGFYFGKRWFGVRVGWWWAILFALMPIYTKLALYSFPQQLIPLVFFLFIASLWELGRKPKFWLFFAAGFLASTVFHLEPIDTPIAYITLFLWLVYLGRNGRIKIGGLTLAVLAAGLVIPLVPNVIYDLRHNFGQLIALGKLISGQDISLLGGMPWYARLIDRPLVIGSMVSRSLTQWNNSWVGLLILGGFVFISWKRVRQKDGQFIGLLALTALVTLGYFLIFPRLLKDYYLYFGPVIITLFLGLVMEQLKTHRLGYRLAAGGLIVWLVIGQIVTVKGLVTSGEQSYRSQLMAVRWVLEQNKGEPFSVYTYTPLIYDYPYQYLFWHLARTQSLRLPTEYAYKPDQPEYVANKAQYDSLIPQNGPDSTKPRIFMILEPGDHLAYSRVYWRSLFSSKEKTRQVFPGGITAVELE